MESKDITIETKTGDDGRLTLQLGGELTIRNVTRIREIFLDHVQSRQAIDVNITEVTALDLTVIQLLISFGKSVGDNMTIRATLPGNILDLVSRAGLSRVFTSVNSVVQV